MSELLGTYVQEPENNICESHFLICIEIIANKDATSNGYRVYMGEKCIGTEF